MILNSRKRRQLEAGRRKSLDLLRFWVQMLGLEQANAFELGVLAPGCADRTNRKLKKRASRAPYIPFVDFHWKKHLLDFVNRGKNA